MTLLPSNENTYAGRIEIKIGTNDNTIGSGMNNRTALPFLLQKTLGHSHLDDSNGQEGMVFILRRIDPERAKELLLFMLDKNWIAPSIELNDFFVEKNCKTPEVWPFENQIVPAQKWMHGNCESLFLQTNNPFLISVNKVIEEHLGDENFRPGCLSKKIFICEMQLHRKLKKLASLSPANYIRKYRLHRSLSFLKEMGLSVSEVSFRVGFRSLEYFSRSFKKEFKISPTKYRGTC